MEKTMKITKKMRFEEMVEIFKSMGRTDLVEFCEHEIELLTAKASKKTTTKNTANDGVKEAIIKALTEIGTKVTITELQKSDVELAEYSNQKLSAMLKQLVDGGTVQKVVDKKKSYFFM